MTRKRVQIFFEDQETGEPLPGHTPAKQSFQDQCDINRIMDKAARTGTISHLERHGATYADFRGFDYEQAMIQTAAAKTMFQELPAETRKEFGNDPGAFLAFVNNRTPEQLATELPALAAPGRQMPATTVPAPATAEQPPTAEPAPSEAPNPPPAEPPAPA